MQLNPPIHKWGKVFKNGPSKICGRQPLKNSEGYDLLPFRLFKGCLSENLLGPCSNTWTQINLLL